MLMLCLLLVPGAARAAYDPPDPGPDFYVLDQAGVMSDQTKSIIINTSRQLDEATGAQVAVVTLKTISDQPISDVSLAIARKWQLGDKKLNNGLLILVVPGGTPGNMSRIEVGYGLEGVLPDAKTGRIQDQYMIPAFRSGNYDQGLRDGYNAVVSEIAKEYGVTLTTDQGNPAPQNNSGSKIPPWAALLIGVGVMVLIWLDYHFFGGFITGLLLNMLFRGGRGGGGGGGGFGGGSGGGGGFGGGGSSR